MPTAVATEVHVLITLLIRAMVKDREAAHVVMSCQEDGTTAFRVVVSPSDVGRLIGKGGRSARSIRVILSAIAHEKGERFHLEIGPSGLRDA